LPEAAVNSVAARLAADASEACHRSGSVTRQRPHPSIYAGLYLPFGAVNGYLTVAIAYQLAQAGVSAEGIGALIALYFMPQTWKFLWAPIVDMTLSSKRWYVIGAVLSALGALGMAVCSARPVNLTVLAAAAVMASLATTLLGMAVEALIAHSTSPEQQGRAGGWLQAGNFAGGGIGGVRRCGLRRMWGTRGSRRCAGCLLFALLPRTHFDQRVASRRTCCRHRRSNARRAARSLGAVRSARAISRYWWCSCRSAQRGRALFSVIPDDWHTSATAVELANGTLSGVISLLGCLAAATSAI